MANGIRTGDPCVFNKDVVQSSVSVPEFDKHLKKARRYIGRNVGENNNKDEDNRPKTLKTAIICFYIRYMQYFHLITCLTETSLWHIIHHCYFYQIPLFDRRPSVCNVQYLEMGIVK